MVTADEAVVMEAGVREPLVAGAGESPERVAREEEEDGSAAAMSTERRRRRR